MFRSMHELVSLCNMYMHMCLHTSVYVYADTYVLSVFGVHICLGLYMYVYVCTCLAMCSSVRACMYICEIHVYVHII